MFNFNVSALTLCQDKVYVFSSEDSLKSCLHGLQKSFVLPAGVYLTIEQFFASLREPSENCLIDGKLRHLAFWRSVMPEEDHSLAICQANSFFAFWQEVNGLGIGFAELEKYLVFSQIDYLKKMLAKRQKYLIKLAQWGFSDPDVAGFDYSQACGYTQPIVFYDCFCFSPCQKNWLKTASAEVELQFSFPEKFYDRHNFSMVDFELKDLQWLNFPQIQIKQYEKKVFMDAGLVNDGNSLAYGKKTEPIFNIFGSDTFLWERKSWQMLSALWQLLADKVAGQRITLAKLLRFIAFAPWQDEVNQELVISKEQILSLINKRYKYFPSDATYQSFLKFLDNLCQDLSYLMAYLKSLDTNCVYWQELQELEQMANLFGLDGQQALQFFVNQSANSVVAIDQNKLKIEAWSKMKPNKQLVIYNATEPFWENFSAKNDFFSCKQREALGLQTEQQRVVQARYRFFSALSHCDRVQIYTYQNLAENVQRACLVDELLTSSWQVNLEEFPDLSLGKLLSLFGDDEKLVSAGTEKEFFFPYNGEELSDFSYSQAARFLEDAQSYYLSDILKIKEFVPPVREIENSLLGEIAHKIFQIWLQTGGNQNLDQIATKVFQDYDDKLPDNFHKVYFAQYVLEKIKRSAEFFKENFAGDKGECEKELQKYFADYRLSDSEGEPITWIKERFTIFKSGKKGSAQI